MSRNLKFTIMNTTEFVTSLTSEQMNALIVVRDELMAANAKQNSELGDAHAAIIRLKQSELDAKTAELSQVTAQRDALAKLLADAKAAYLSGDHPAVQALIAESEKSEQQKAIEAAEADVKAAEEKLAALKETNAN